MEVNRGYTRKYLEDVALTTAAIVDTVETGMADESCLALGSDKQA